MQPPMQLRLEGDLLAIVAASLAPRCLAVYDRCDFVGESSQFGIGKIGENNDRQVVVNVSNQQRFKSLPRAVMIMNIFSTLSLQLPRKSIRAFPTV